MVNPPELPMTKLKMMHILQAVAYLEYGRHGTCHGHHFDGGVKLLGKN